MRRFRVFKICLNSPSLSLSLSLSLVYSYRDHLTMTIEPTDQAEAGPSGSSNLTAGSTPYHESSQFLHWRYSPSQLQSIRSELNLKSVEIVGRNRVLEKVHPSSIQSSSAV